MKIAHVVTYLSADHAFGGPLSVALTQTRELASRGHEVELFCGWDGVADVEGQGVTVRRFPVRQAVPGFGLRGLRAPGLNRQLFQTRYDIVHVHLARDLVTLGAATGALRRRIPYVVQPHGMVAPDHRLRAKVADLAATRRVLHGAASVVALTDEEATRVTAVARRPLPVVLLGNGVPLARVPADGAHPAPGPPDVLFLARLHPRKRVRTFAAMAELLVERGVSARFSVVGPDEGDLGALHEHVRRAGLAPHLTYEGPMSYDRVPSRIAQAAVFVVPSVDEPFGMTILEALSVGTPTVVNDSIHIADVLRAYGAALVTDGSPTALADAVEHLLADRDEVHRLQEGGRRALKEEFGIEAIVDRLEKIYLQATG